MVQPSRLYTPPRLMPLTAIQKQLLMDEVHRFVVTPSGRRSRKTLIGSRKTHIRALRRGGQRIFEGAPTRAQAKAIFWERLKRELKPFQKKTPNETDLILTLLNDTEIHVVGLDKPQRVEGQPWHGFHITEMADVKTGAWNLNLRPLLSDTNGWAYLDGVPEGRGEWYDINLIACGGAIPLTIPGIGAYMENPVDPEWAYYHWHSADVLSPKEIESAKRHMDEMSFKQEYEGSFEGGEGLAYYPFSNKNLKPMELDKGKLIHIGMDFNYSPMSSIAAQEYNLDGRVVPHVLESFGFRNCDTGPACDRIIDRFGDDCHYVIYPDPACQNRSTHGEGGKTDLAIIRQSFQRVTEKGSYQIRVKSAAPKRKDRLNAVNAKLRNALGEIGMYLHPEACKNLVTDFQKATREEYLNGNFKDTSIGHVSDALGYYIEYRFPIGKGAVNPDNHTT